MQLDVPEHVAPHLIGLMCCQFFISDSELEPGLIVNLPRSAFLSNVKMEPHKYAAPYFSILKGKKTFSCKIYVNTMLISCKSEIEEFFQTLFTKISSNVIITILLESEIIVLSKFFFINIVYLFI